MMNDMLEKIVRTKKVILRMLIKCCLFHIQIRVTTSCVSFIERQGFHSC